ncbi:MAG: glycoside hydrolase family 65 protein [Bacilli bacterium]|nr:glycoside hydrolase family 65 protein [Bacilli bacterium]
MFLLGNGHLGYRGTLEEYQKSEMVGLNVVGFYDRYKDKWRESVNMPNPFYLKIENYSILDNDYVSHEIELDIKNAVFKRKTTFNNLFIKSERFVSQSEDLICFKYQIMSSIDQSLHISLGTDLDIYEINGPHFSSMNVKQNDLIVEFKGITNENEIGYLKSQYIIPKNANIKTFNNGIYTIEINAISNKIYTFYCFSKISKNTKINSFHYDIKDYASIKATHKKIFNEKWNNSDVVIQGNKEAQFAIRYSIYHLLILGNEKYQTSIPARGVSGQTYKGAIFWDSEIFLLPFFTLTNPLIAKQLLKYRINTLNGAKEKAKEEGYDGAFYAWESQENGEERCSKYNVTDPITNEPVRTYFGEKQIHISADIAYALIQYVNISGDTSILFDDGLYMMLEIIKFFMSYSTFENGQFHLYDVIGPDEYHERVDDNAFTNYLVKFVLDKFIEFIDIYDYSINGELLEKIKYFNDNLYLPRINENNIIEQFSGYLKKEDVYVDEVRKRITHPQEYWGTENGVAFNTRVIKQADVVTLLSLLNEQFSKDVLKANFEFYYPYTEHGSSLSASMYSIVASLIGENELAYDNFIKSATIDLGTNQKIWAGGIYIGGTHPASNGGSYLSLVIGMAGLRFINNEIRINPNLPKNIKGLKFKVFYKNKQYLININKTNSKVEELYD